MILESFVLNIVGPGLSYVSGMYSKSGGIKKKRIGVVAGIVCVLFTGATNTSKDDSARDTQLELNQQIARQSQKIDQLTDLVRSSLVAAEQRGELASAGVTAVNAAPQGQQLASTDRPAMP